MESQLSQDSLDRLIAPSDFSEPTTPELAHSSIPESPPAAVNKVQSSRTDNAPSGAMTPPPSTQVPPSRAKTRTPTPPISHISTPPPTAELRAEGQRGGRIAAAGRTGSMTADELEAASADELRAKVVELQAALQEAKMSAAHHKLQYQMLSQESAAALERMAVEARMEQKEDAVIYHAEQARAAATPVQQSPVHEGTIPVETGLYQRMMRDLQIFSEDNAALRREIERRDGMLDRQDNEIASLTDKVTLMRERIRENRDHLNRSRRQPLSSRVHSTPRSVFTTPNRAHASSQHQPQPFAALLQASEMASQESARSAHGRASSGKKGHVRNTHSMSSLPTTPHRMPKMQQPVFHTPSGRQAPLQVPSTAPVPRTSAMRTPNVYRLPSLRVPHASAAFAPQSDGTVSASDHDDNDSEAETDIIERDEEVSESHASRAASQMLRSNQEQEAKRNSFKGSGMLERPAGDGLTQTKLTGAVRKANVDRDDGRPAKRARMGAPPVGLGIAGVRD